MASTAAVPAVSAAAAKASADSSGPNRRHAAVSLRLPSKLQKPSLLPVKGLGFCRERFAAKAQLNEVVGGSSNDAAPSKTKAEASSSEENSTALEKQNPPLTLLSQEAISEFMTQAASLVKLVDSRDIVELKLKQQDCELIISKKMALPQPLAPAPLVMTPQPSAPAAIPPPAISVPSPASGRPAPPPSSVVGPNAPKSSQPPLKSPMAGTFYRSPGPSQPPFVKVGDKVNKGQVLCIIEAMKLMNEIEADQAGTVVEILVDDGKPVGIDQPIFVIEP